MKYCPACQNRYTDDLLKFCLQDGTELITETSSQSSTPTVAFDNEGPETVVRQPRGNRIEFDLQKPPERVQPLPQQQPRTANIPAEYEAEPKKSNTGLIVLATILATVLLLAIGGVGAWMYFSRDAEIASGTTNSNLANRTNISDNSAQNLNKNASAPTPNVNANKSVKPTPSATPAPNFDAEEVKAEVGGVVNSWISQTQSGDVEALMKYYGNTVNYYNRKSLSSAGVRADKLKAFSSYDTVEMDVSDVKITPDPSGETATAVFDKSWRFENPSKVSEGKVQSELRFQNFNGVWKIVSERDLKVYYVNQ